MPVVGDTEKGDPGYAQHQAAHHIGEPMDAQVEPRQGHPADQQAGQAVGQPAPLPLQAAGKQDGEETVEGHSPQYMGAGEGPGPQGLTGRRWPGYSQAILQQQGRQQAEKGSGEQVPAHPVASPPAQDQGHAQGEEQKRPQVSRGAEGGHQVIAPGCAQALQGGVDQLIQAGGERTAQHHPGDQHEEQGGDQQQGGQCGQSPGLRMLRVGQGQGDGAKPPVQYAPVKGPLHQLGGMGLDQAKQDAHDDEQQPGQQQHQE